MNPPSSADQSPHGPTPDFQPESLQQLSPTRLIPLQAVQALIGGLVGGAIA
ncbi:hypothetical protein FRC03_005932 [Tulasnella sp. 419]|nr:hypothetical protein FRC02_005525 [Tulasnella sp. 418]KAG8939860.1 hypothetical protein FRC03_005932 [Tulasnella sp. 419]